MYYSFFFILTAHLLRVWAVDTEEKLQFYFKRTKCLLSRCIKENFKDTQIFEQSFYLFVPQHIMFWSPVEF